jgi:hypothetical protein
LFIVRRGTIPPQTENCVLSILRAVDTLARKYACPGFLIVGDFNTVDTSVFNKYLCYKQVVINPTRGHKILDKIFTNCSSYYASPAILPPIGKSDHNTVLLSSDNCPRESSQAGYHTVKRRRLDYIAVNNIALDLVNYSWRNLYRLDNPQLQTDLFYSVVSSIVNLHAPVLITRIKNNDKPWITNYFRHLIDRRDVAFKSGSVVLYRKLRNQVNRVRKSLKTQYYLDQVAHLKSQNPRNWWQQIKQLSGAIDANTCHESFVNLTRNDEFINYEALPNVLNEFFTSVASDSPPLDSKLLTNLRNNLDHVPDHLIILESSVYYALKRLNINHSSCDDIFTNRLLVDLADILAAPICAIINSSIRHGIVPTQWKVARVVPIPKVNPPLLVESDLRPISVTSGIAKVAESFICNLFNEHFNSLTDINQFGCTSNRSTVHALIKLTDLFFRSSDDCDNFIRILFVDFAKAFDLVNHNALFRKFLQYHFPLILQRGHCPFFKSVHSM